MGQDFTASNSIRISWDTFHRDCVGLGKKLAELGTFRGILGVSRGGLVPAAILATTMDLRLVDTVCVVSYDDRVQRDGEPEVIKGVDGDGSGWLVVDDLVDSGKTLRRLRHALPKAHFAAVYAKPNGLPVVDTYLVPVEQHMWLTFPWDAPPAAE